MPGQVHCSAAKHGVVGLTTSAAVEHAEFKVRVNAVHTWGVGTVFAAVHSVGALRTELLVAIRAHA
ncbi:SDR family NAD(P)-dependent oxidoreductase [Mycolicibacterium llatzerense]|uniref:SDR family NAD(P)-dependent oxidoreductase n=1 Tax=Mycolicibacterium llatzerense TaxID=280871 RepID=UPI0036F21823